MLEISTADLDVSPSKGANNGHISTVSVIILTHNHPDLLARALRSILAQTKLPVEIIIVNYGVIPVNDTIAQYNATGIIRYIVHDNNEDSATARNIGIQMAKGEYIAMLDDYGMYLPNHLEIMVAALKESSCKFAYSFADYIVEDMQNNELVPLDKRQLYPNVVFSMDELLVENFIPTSAWVFLRTLVSEVGAFEHYFGSLEDWEWLIRAANKTDFLTVSDVTLGISQGLNDVQHVLPEQNAQLLRWVKSVYDKHPVTSAQLQLARHERVTFGAAKHLNQEQDMALAATFNAAMAGSLDLITLITITETLNSWNLRNRTVSLYQQWIKHIGTSPLLHAAWFNLAVTLHNLNQYEEAVTAYLQAVAISPSFNLARFQLAALQEQRGRPNEAIENWRTIVRLQTDKNSPDYEQASLNLTRIQSVGNHADSQGVFDSSMKLLIKFPTRDRKDKFFHVLDLYYELLDDIDTTEFCITIDEDDLTMNNVEVLEKLGTYKNLYCYVGHSKSKIEAVNADIPSCNEFDILLLASDDMIPQIKGYDRIIRNRMEALYPDKEGVLWFYDGHRRDLNTLVCMGCEYYKRFGYIYHPAYKSFYCDNEFMLVAEALHKQVFLDEIIIMHEHPDYAIYRDKSDELYVENNKYYSVDFSTFELRKKNNFDLLKS
jgi:glycosyltransferase involved in cell wall biosynthesis